MCSGKNKARILFFAVVVSQALWEKRANLHVLLYHSLLSFLSLFLSHLSSLESLFLTIFLPLPNKLVNMLYSLSHLVSYIAVTDHPLWFHAWLALVSDQKQNGMEEEAYHHAYEDRAGAALVIDGPLSEAKRVEGLAWAEEWRPEHWTRQSQSYGHQDY